MKHYEFWQNVGLSVAGLLVFYGLLYYARTHIETAPLNLTELNSSTSSPIQKIKTIFSAPVIKTVTLPPIFSEQNNDALPIASSTTSTTTPTTTASSTIMATMTVGPLTYNLSLPNGSTLYDALNKTGTSTSDMIFSFKTAGYGNLTVVSEINGQPNYPPLYWTYYVNGVMGTSSISEYKLNDGDTIDWKLQ